MNARLSVSKIEYSEDDKITDLEIVDRKGNVVFNYVASMRYVFKHKEDMSRRREFVIFVVLSVIGLIINNALMWAGVELIPWPDWLQDHAYLIVKIFATAVVMVWNFVTRKIFLDAGDQHASN